MPTGTLDEKEPRHTVSGVGNEGVPFLPWRGSVISSPPSSGTRGMFGNRLSVNYDTKLRFGQRDNGGNGNYLL